MNYVKGLILSSCSHRAVSRFSCYEIVKLKTKTLSLKLLAVMSKLLVNLRQRLHSCLC